MTISAPAAVIEDITVMDDDAVEVQEKVYLFAGLQLSSGLLTKNGNEYSLPNFSNIVETNKTKHSYTELGRLFEKADFSASNDGNIDNLLDPFNGWRLPTSIELGKILTTDANVRPGSTVNGVPNVHRSRVSIIYAINEWGDEPERDGGLLVFPDGETIFGTTLNSYDSYSSETELSSEQLSEYLSQGCVLLCAMNRNWWDPGSSQSVCCWTSRNAYVYNYYDSDGEFNGLPCEAQSSKRNYCYLVKGNISPDNEDPVKPSTISVKLTTSYPVSFHFLTDPDDPNDNGPYLEYISANNNDWSQWTRITDGTTLTSGNWYLRGGDANGNNGICGRRLYLDFDCDIPETEYCVNFDYITVNSNEWLNCVNGISLYLGLDPNEDPQYVRYPFVTISGNLRMLYNYKNPNAVLPDKCFDSLFSPTVPDASCSSIVWKIDNLVFPSSSDNGNQVFYEMFKDCFIYSLPTLPEETNSCYSQMYKGAKVLTNFNTYDKPFNDVTVYQN